MPELITSIPISNNCSHISGVIPKPFARFSPFTITKFKSYFFIILFSIYYQFLIKNTGSGAAGLQLVPNTTGYSTAIRTHASGLFYLQNTPLAAPSNTYPAYVLGGANETTYGNTITVYPNDIDTAGQVITQYIRYPKNPNWTYAQLPGGEPSFDESASDYLDSDLPISDETNLINKILQYAGVSIRDASVAQFGKAEEVEAFRKNTIQQTILLCIGGLFMFVIGNYAPSEFMQHMIVFALACFVGFQVIWNVSHALHTPLMAVTNAISGIIIIGAVLQMTSESWVAIILAAISILISTINIVGGFLVTRRMLAMFQKS